MFSRTLLLRSDRYQAGRVQELRPAAVGRRRTYSGSGGVFLESGPIPRPIDLAHTSIPLCVGCFTHTDAGWHIILEPTAREVSVQSITRTQSTLQTPFKTRSFHSTNQAHSGAVPSEPSTSQARSIFRAIKRGLHTSPFLHILAPKRQPDVSATKPRHQGQFIISRQTSPRIRTNSFRIRTNSFRTQTYSRIPHPD